jgi:transcription initiation factor IIE alpha subunit
MKSKKIPSRSDCDPNILRIYDLLVARRKMTPEKLSKIFGIADWNQSSAKWRYLESGLRFLDELESDDDLYGICKKCGHRNPFDTNYDNMTEKEAAEFSHPCENCGEPLFSL